MQAHSHLLTPSYLKPYIPLGVSYSSEVVLALQTDCVGVTFTKFCFNTRHRGLQDGPKFSQTEQQSQCQETKTARVTIVTDC